jgi:hypothetical protein
VGHPGAAPARPTPGRLDGRPAHAEDPVGRRVWGHGIRAVGSPHLPAGGMRPPCTAPRRVAPPRPPPAVPAGAWRGAPPPTPPSPDARVGVGRSLAAIGLGPPRPHDGPACAPWRPVRVRARHATPRPPTEPPARVPADGRHHARQAHACPPALAAVAVRLSPDAAAGSRPPQGAGAVPHGIGPRRGRHGRAAVRGRGLAHRPARHARQRRRVARRGDSPHAARVPSGLRQRAPPAGAADGAGR